MARVSSGAEVAALFLLSVIFLAAIYLGFRRFEYLSAYHPSRRPSGIIPQTFGLAYEDLRLRTADGENLHAWFLPAAPFRLRPLGRVVEGPLAKLGLVVLYCHGNAGNITDRVEKADVFHRLGLGVLLFDYRGYGESSGRPSEQGTYRDAEAAWRYLNEVRRIPPKRIVIYGGSLGGAVALETELRHLSRALILESAFTSVPAMARAIFPRLPLSWALDLRYDNLDKIGKIRCPVLIMHSPEDRTVPFRMGQELFAAAPNPKEFFRLRGDHNEGYLESGAAYAEAIERFLARAAAHGFDAGN